MREEPLFNDDILVSIYRHFSFFFTYSDLIIYAALVFFCAVFKLAVGLLFV